MADDEVALDLFIQQRCAQSGLDPSSNSRNLWRDFHAQALRCGEKTPPQDTEVAQLRHELAQVRRELASLRREQGALWVRTFGGTVAEAKEAGFRFKAGAPDTGKVHGLKDSVNSTFELVESIHDLLLGPLSERAEGETGGLVKSLLDLEQRVGDGMRYQGIHEPGREYKAGDVCTRSGSMWVARENTAETPGQGSTPWQMACKAGRDGRDLMK